ncbi:hypothetical protein O6H91_02G015200 [Diphasiastrum complanatum]|uniref:Uncharacterized protein n=1 Tax=Diphasiastrum complanatum TaxID=34168 RepID=A0ACC2ED02_DIPCM|nr:hypothetical protein O6H91_02G015200 [Diphasiastrum complanatum]
MSNMNIKKFTDFVDVVYSLVCNLKIPVCICVFLVQHLKIYASSMSRCNVVNILSSACVVVFFVAAALALSLVCIRVHLQDVPDLPHTMTKRQIKKDTRIWMQSSKLHLFFKNFLKRSKENAVKNKREIEDKYCLRGAEWGVGDCSLAAASKEEKEAFLKAFEKRNAGN